MTKKPKSPAASDAYEPETLYEVTLSRVVDGPTGPLSPGKRNMVKGKHIAALGDAVTDARAV